MTPTSARAHSTASLPDEFPSLEDDVVDGDPAAAARAPADLSGMRAALASDPVTATIAAYADNASEATAFCEAFRAAATGTDITASEMARLWIEPSRECSAMQARGAHPDAVGFAQVVVGVLRQLRDKVEALDARHIHQHAGSVAQKAVVMAAIFETLAEQARADAVVVKLMEREIGHLLDAPAPGDGDRRPMPAFMRTPTNLLRIVVRHAGESLITAACYAEGTAKAHQKLAAIAAANTGVDGHLHFHTAAELLPHLAEWQP